MNPWKKIVILSVIALLIASTSPEVRAFCGFYVAKADAKLFNKSSQVVLARIDDKTVLTMANDYEGDLKEFAIVVPVPTVLEKDQIHVGEKSVIERIDTFTSPRLVEYFDENPCAIQYDYERKSDSVKSAESPSGNFRKKNGHGVTIEAQYTVGEYDILILSAKESGGLESWLTDNGYKIPKGASAVLAVYIKQNMKFFVAKVNLKEQSKTGFSYLRPIQMAFESPKFMLPIRLGMVNANGSQDLFIYALTTKGRIETTNYRTVKIPSNVEIPVYVKENFSEFYKGMFSSQLKKEDLRVVFLEHAWDMSWCDPCATEPLSNEEMKKLGVFWLGGSGNNEKMMRRQPLAAPQ
ncbi:MAG: DUF2330 domain-containing protein [Leptospira sp.]|nr:DUF2330 domain-containing protein [Leptospira sp.]